MVSLILYISVLLSQRVVGFSLFMIEGNVESGQSCGRLYGAVLLQCNVSLSVLFEGKCFLISPLHHLVADTVCEL